MNVSSVLTLVRHILAPPFCFYCREYAKMGDRLTQECLCVGCANLIKPILSHRIPLSEDYSMQVHAASAYEPPLKSLILAKGWSDYTASKKLGALMWQYTVLRSIPFDYLIPIPLHRSREASRGYNQAAVIAQQLSVLSNKPLLTCLKRTKKTKFQSLFSKAERHDNVKGAFMLDSSDIEGKVIVLVDDLMTTGATLYEAGKELIRGNPKELYALVACRVI